jgi:hypothetical protein
MNTDRDTARIVRSWLRTDEHDSADRVLDHVLAVLDATPQHRPWWPVRRIADMNLFAKLATAAALVLVVVVVGLSFAPRGTVGPGTSATPTPSPVATPPPTASPTPAAFPPQGRLAMGTRHRIVLEGVPFTFTVPSDAWTSNGVFGIDKDPGIGPAGAGFILWTDTPVGVFTDPCTQKQGPDLGTDIADLAAAVATIPGVDVMVAPTDVMVDGHPAKEVAIKIRNDIGCEPDQFYLWYAPTPDFGRYATRKGSTIKTWIIDVDGTIVWIDGETYAGAGPEPYQEVQAIVDSIRFDQAG